MNLISFKLILLLFLFFSYSSSACLLSNNSYESITNIYEKINAVTELKYIIDGKVAKDGKAKSTRLHAKLLALSYDSSLSEQGAFVFNLNYLTGGIFLHHSNRAQEFYSEYLKGDIDIKNCLITFKESEHSRYRMSFQAQGFSFTGDSKGKNDSEFTERLRFNFY